MHIHRATTASAKPPKQTRTHILEGRLPGRCNVAQLHPAHESWSTSPALAHFYQIGHLALYQNGNSWEKEGIGIVVQLPALMKQAGFEVLPMETQRIDLGYGTEGYKIGVKDYKVLLRDIMPFCIKTGVATKEQLEALYADTLKEIVQPDFNAHWLFSRVVGRRPA